MTVLTVGAPKTPWVGDAVRAYMQRISRWVPLGWEHVPESRGQRGKDPRGVEDEGQRILRALQPRDAVALLDERGQMFPSEAFSHWLFEELARASGRWVFVIGGAYGVSDTVRSRASVSIALSPMTLPHELCFVVLCEQIYRAVTIRQKIPYHHA